MYAKYVTSCILKSTFFFFLEVSQYFCPSSVPTQYDVGPTARFNIIQQKKERKKCKSFWGELILICWWTLRTLMSAHLRFYQSHEHFRLIRDAVFFSFFLWSFLPIIVTKQKKKWSWGLSTGNISCREDPSNKSTFLHLPLLSDFVQGLLCCHACRRMMMQTSLRKFERLSPDFPPDWAKVTWYSNSPHENCTK